VEAKRSKTTIGSETEMTNNSDVEQKSTKIYGMIIANTTISIERNI